ncbi:MAG: hypothetical protein ACM3SQ_01415 [Betaproteobacteria bacterium]
MALQSTEAQSSAADDRPLDETWTDAAAAQPGKVAVLVAHGMGQQVPFETIDLVSRLLHRTLLDGVGPDAPIVTRFVRLPGNRVVPRAEIVADLPEGRTEVHVYEAYWAPLTEGAVTLRDVAMFLARAGASAFLTGSWFRFDRFLFNDWQSYPVGPSTALRLLEALAAFAALSILNVAIVVGTVGWALSPRGGWPPTTLLDAWTADLLLFGVPMALTSLTLWLVALRERDRRYRATARRRPGGRLGDAGNVLLHLTMLLLITAGVLAALHAVGLVRTPFAGFGGRLAPTSRFLVWTGALAVSVVLRWFLVEFVGDVAAYVSAPWLDRFNRLRDAIKKTAVDVGQGVYANRTYEHVVVLGHSLGSVVAYDVLNGLINDDLLASAAPGGRPRDVVARTRTLVTFGSPLDKTAFIFRRQGGSSHAVREALAAAVQPIVVRDAWRPGRWINIWSRRDWISGPLEYYDRPGESRHIDRRTVGEALAAIAAAPPGHVCNVVDPDARMPVLAHVQYWTNPLLAKCLAAAVIPPPSPPAAGGRAA